MNKKIATTALVMLCLAAVFAFAASPTISYSEHNIRVQSYGPPLASVELCITYIDAAGKEQTTSIEVTNIPALSNKNKNYKDVAFTIGKVKGAYSSYCKVEMTPQ